MSSRLLVVIGEIKDYGFVVRQFLYFRPFPLALVFARVAAMGAAVLVVPVRDLLLVVTGPLKRERKERGPFLYYVIAVVVFILLGLA